MRRPTSLLQRIPRIPHRIYWEFRVWILSVLPLWWINRYGHAPITQPDGPVVSLTTYGYRLRTVYLVIESIARGRLLPSRIILWIDDKDFFDNLPAPIRRLKQRGLEVTFCENYGAHKKYYPYLQSQNTFDTPLVTADDDVFYPDFWLQDLMKAYIERPDIVNCFCASVFRLSEHGIAKNSEWKISESTEPDFRNCAIGYSGIIYPPAFLTILKKLGTSFKDYCPTADDFWLHIQELRAGYRVRQIRPKALRFLSVPGSQVIGLWKDNEYGGNDRQIEATYTTEDVQKMLEECARTGNDTLLPANLN